MKNKNLILSVLFWVVASCAFAITLPTSSYSGFESATDYNVDYSSTIGIGRSTSIIGSYLRISESYDGSCNDNPPVSSQRTLCCAEKVAEVFQETLTDCAKNNNVDCLEYYSDCLSSASLPLGSPLLLLPFIAVYALVRRRKEETL